MLDALRRGAQGWLAKILFALLIISFGVFWNVSDVYRGYGRGSIASVGEEEVTVSQFQRAFQNEMKTLQRDGDSRITNEQALLFGVDRQVLDQLVAQAAVKQHAERLGLDLSTEALVEGVRTDPNFAGPDGKFSRIGFDNLLSAMGLSEAGFFAVRREDEIRRQVLDTIRSTIVAPAPLVRDLSAWREETRTLEHVQIDPAKVTVAEPDDAKLRETYEANKSRFMTPEYRKLAVLFLAADDLKKEIELTDEEVRASYTETKSSYDKAERRRIQQIAFKDKAQAEAARKELVEGKKNFMDVAKEVGAKETDVNLGMLEKSQLIDPAIAEAAFAIERDKLSEVIEGRFTPVLIRVIEISPGKESTFEEAKDKVRDRLALKRATDLLQERIDIVEEGRNAGKTLQEIGAEQKLRFVEADAVDRENKTPEKKTGIDQPNAELVLTEAFRSQPGLANDPVELASDAFAWFDVVSVAEPKQRPFEEVKDEVKSFYVDTERSRLLNEMAEKLVDRIKAGEDMAKIAEEAGGKVELSESIKRQMSPPGLTADAVKFAFTLPKGGAGSAETSDRASRVVFKVKDIIPASEPSKEQSDKLASEVRGSLEGDVLLAYVAALKSDFGVTVNEAELKRATGAATDQ